MHLTRFSFRFERELEESEAGGLGLDELISFKMHAYVWIPSLVSPSPFLSSLISFKLSNRNEKKLASNLNEN